MCVRTLFAVLCLQVSGLGFTHRCQVSVIPLLLLLRSCQKRQQRPQSRQYDTQLVAVSRRSEPCEREVGRWLSRAYVLGHDKWLIGKICWGIKGTRCVP